MRSTSKALLAATLLALAAAAPAAAQTTSETVRVGQALTLRLDSNPATGYSWTVESLDRRYVRLLSQRFVPGQGIGAPGQDILHFGAIKPIRRTAIQLIYQQPFNPGVDVTRRTVNVRVLGR